MPDFLQKSNRSFSTRLVCDRRSRSAAISSARLNCGVTRKLTGIRLQSIPAPTCIPGSSYSTSLYGLAQHGWLSSAGKGSPVVGLEITAEAVSSARLLALGRLVKGCATLLAEQAGEGDRRDLRRRDYATASSERDISSTDSLCSAVEIPERKARRRARRSVSSLSCSTERTREEGNSSPDRAIRISSNPN